MKSKNCIASSTLKDEDFFIKQRRKYVHQNALHFVEKKTRNSMFSNDKLTINDHIASAHWVKFIKADEEATILSIKDCNNLIDSIKAIVADMELPTEIYFHLSEASPALNRDLDVNELMYETCLSACTPLIVKSRIESIIQELMNNQETKF